MQCYSRICIAAFSACSAFMIAVSLMGQEGSLYRIYGKLLDQKWQYDQSQPRNSVTGVLVKDVRDGGVRLVVVDANPCKKEFFYFKNPDTKPTGETVTCDGERLPEYRVIAAR